MNAIEIDNLTVRYGQLTAVDGVSLSIAEGEIFGLVGPNGAGKTTTLKVLAGLIYPDEGTARVVGRDVCLESDAVRGNLGYMADFFGVYDYLTVYEYLAFFGGMYGLEDPELDIRILRTIETVNLATKLHSYVKTLSRGMKQRLYFARAMIHGPRVLILDEPASGLDPRGRAELVDTLTALNRRGKTIVISSHILGELQDFVTSVGIMEKGSVTAVRSLRGGETAARRRVLLQVLPADVDRALGLLERHDGVTVVERGAEGLVLEIEDADNAVAALVQLLVSKNVRVLLPRADGADLKEIFLKLTKGELM